MTAEWLPGEGRDADDEAFLAELRRRAVTERLADIRPEDTGTSLYEVGFDPGHAHPDPLVACWETHGYLLDQWTALSGYDPTPVGAAGHAFTWMSEQIRRPVVRRDWVRRWRRDHAEWLLADTGQLLRSDFLFAHGSPRGRPQETRLR